MFILAWAIFMFLNFHTVVVSGVSMQPTFHTGQRVVVSQAYWLVGAVRQKDILVIRDNNPDGFIIKRVFRMAGEIVPKSLAPRNWPIENDKYLVPQGKFYVLGDNMDQSEDSRAFGPIDADKVLGKVVVWP